MKNGKTVTKAVRRTRKIAPEEVRFIKLGSGGDWEHSCIDTAHPTIRLGFVNPYHKECLLRRWTRLKKFWLQEKAQGKATESINQVKDFYTLTDRTLWITFYKRRLYWAFAHPDVRLESDGTRTRRIIGKWRCHSITGEELFVDRLSGRLTKIQGFRGTICSVWEAEYLIKRINGGKLPEVEDAEKRLHELHDSIQPLIQHLGWKDFELLCDLIFTNGGWRRISRVGGTEKAIDLDLSAPVSGKRAFVQIKSEAGESTLTEYYESFATMTQYDEMYFVVHSPHTDPDKWHTPEGVIVLGPRELSRLAVSAGLTEWIIEKNT